MIRKLLRWGLRVSLLVCGPAAVAIAGLYVYVSSGRYVTTENAYVKSDLIIVTAEVTGRITQVAIEDNTQVSEGQLLVSIDPRRYEIERDRRAADLGAARRDIQALQARYRAKKAALESVIKDTEYLREELERSERLRSGGTISQTRLLEVRREMSAAESRIVVVQEEIAELLAELGGSADDDVDRHPHVVRAASELRRAEVDLESARVTAPNDAVVANLNLQVGEYVEEGDPILSLVEDRNFWIEANLKETDLTHLEVGQLATLRIDAYPDVEWQGQVSSLSPATGAEYALLPPQNASGNWVKVVQRVPVLVSVKQQPGSPPLRAGMSVAVSIDTGFERPLPEVLGQARAWILTDQPE